MTSEKAARAKELLARLIAFDTTSHKSNLALIAFVASYLAEHGVASEQVPNAEGDKASLFATIGPPGVPGCALSGHTDVVPAAADCWSSDPFTLTERGDRLYGRGTADMKGFLACVLAAVPDFVRLNLATPLHIIFSYDEEVGCLGVRPLIAELGRRFVKPRVVIVGEPTEMCVVDAHKGPARWQIEIKGRAAHSSRAPLGVNAITYAGRLLGELERLEQEIITARADPRFDPPHTTLQVTLIAGGTAANIVPAQCRMSVEARTLPGFDIAGLEARMRTYAESRLLPEMLRTAPEAAASIQLVNDLPPFAAGPASEAVSLALRLTGENGTAAVSFATEAGLFEKAGCASVVCGPGSIAQGHTDDEWIATDQLVRCLAFLDSLGNSAAR